MSLFQRIFGKKDASAAMSKAEMVNVQAAHISPWSGDAYGNDIYRAGVDAIARNAAKLKGGHVVAQDGGNAATTDGKLNRLFQVQPNEYMNAYDLLYKLVTHLYLYNNAFAYLQRDDTGRVTGIYPLQAANIDIMADPSGAMYCRFMFKTGKQAVLPYSDIVHLRRHFNENEIFGDDNAAVTAALELAHTQNQGIVAGIKNGANIRGILSFTQILSPEKLKAEKDKFMEDYLSMANDGGS